MAGVDSIPTFDADVFAPAALRQPFDMYRTMRDIGPVVRLETPDVYALSRFADVRDALKAPEILISGQGVGFSEAFNRPGAPNVLQSDGALHSRMKAHVLRPLMPAQLAQYREGLAALVGARIRDLVDAGPFDAMEKIARLLPVVAISEFVGLPDEGRERMLEWAAATFNALGPPAPGFERDFTLIREAFGYTQIMDASTVREGSWAASLFKAAEDGKLTLAEARGALSAYVVPSLDTTILAMGHLLRQLAATPGQWERLKAEPHLVPGAAVEAVRHSSVVRWFSRVAQQDYSVEGRVIPEGARVMLMYQSANRDERRFANPDAFDIARDARDQLGWGTGRHTCAGLNLAKMEMEVMLEGLLRHCDAIEAGDPVIADNRGLYGFASLPMELRSRKHA